MLTTKALRFIQQKRTNWLSQKYAKKLFCSESSDNDKKKKTTAPPETKPKTQKSEEALKKLNLLLKQMVQEDYKEPLKKVNLAKPKGRSKEKKEHKENKDDILVAAKDVAKSLGGNVKQTESELLNKLLTPITKETSEDSGNKALNLNEVIAGMKIDRSVKPEVGANVTSKAFRVKQFINRDQLNQVEQKSRYVHRKPTTPSSVMDKIDLFGGETLGIFTNTNIKFKDEQLVLKTWDKLHERELQLAMTHPPSNYFEEMILWTKQGKIWKFPIDNEAGMDEEKNVFFAEHIFLEKHLEPWCPHKGPIRHFMELVCVGLSKNPYLTVQAKRDHIEWFKSYFTSKEDLLKEVGAIPANLEKIKELDG